MNKKLRKNLGIFLISLSSATVLLGSGSEIEAAKRKDYSLNGDKNETGDENKDFEEQVKELYENNIRTYVEKIDEASAFHNGMAEIKFWVGDMSYRGFIDTEGKMKFYIPLESGNYSENTGLDNGYVTHFINDTLFVIDSEGNILSHYDKNQVVCYGGGYTWVREDSSNDWNDAGTCKYTFYDPSGAEVQDVSFSVSNDQSYQESFRYHGDGAFSYQTMENEVNDTFCFYFTGNAQKQQYNTSFMRDRDDQFESGYVLDLYQDEDGMCHIERMSNQGEYQDIVIPKECSTEDGASWYIRGKSENYILLSDSTGTLVAYDIQNSAFQRYTGQYAGSLNCDYSELQGNVIAVKIYGKNDKDYVGLINIENMTEIGEPIETNDFQLAKEVLITYWDDKKVMYDLNGNETFTCGYYADVYSAGEGATVMSDDSGYHYVKSDGSDFFPDGIDYDNARNLDVDLRKQTIG